MEVAISDIKIGNRHRKDLGNIEDLAASIESIGLLHPVVVLADYTLVVGERRLEAHKHLNRTHIRVNVAENLADVQKFVEAECQENTCRKSFTPEEAVEIGERIEAIAAEEAKKRHADGVAAGGKTGGKGRKKTGDVSSGLKKPRATRDESKRTTAVAAKAVGMGRSSYEKAKVLVNKAKKSKKARKLLDEANRTGNISGAAKKLKVSEQVEALSKEPPPLPTGPFRVIVVDPPWMYGNRADDPTHRSSNPYPSMTIEQITALPIGDIAETDAILWLWTTNSHIPHSFAIAQAWGFEYKTMLTWVKNKMGTGDWLRGKTEHCLMCVKGKPVTNLNNETTVLNGPMRQHSQKPEEFYEMVEKLCPGSKVEVFSRMNRKEWFTYGDETGKLAG